MSPAFAKGDDARVGLPLPRRMLAITAVLTAMALVVLDAGMVNVALPTMARSLAATAADAVLVVTAYQTALVMALLPCAALGERFGNRRVFQAGVAIFVCGSVLCAVSPSLPFLVAARFVQGLGGAAVMALGVALLASGGLPASAGSTRRLDMPSMAMNGAVFLLLILAAGALPRSPALGATLFVLAAVAFLLLVRRESPKAAPMFPLDLLRNRSFRLSVIASVCCFTGQAAGMVALPFYLQHGLDLSPLAVGLYISPWPLSVAATTAVTGRLADRIPTAWLCAAGAAILAMGLIAGAVWPLDNDPSPLLLFSALCGIGFGLFQAPNNRNMFGSAPPERSGAAGGMQGTARLTGQVAGAVVMTILFSSVPLISAPRLGLAIGAVFAVAASLVSLSRTPIRKVTSHVAF
jgi:DHA2 family multidrug resistance protein-like MFS transporter